MLVLQASRLAAEGLVGVALQGNSASIVEVRTIQSSNNAYAPGLYHEARFSDLSFVSSAFGVFLSSSLCIR